MVRTSVIILNYNQPGCTIECVKSVLKQSDKDFEILLVDNASKDDSVAQFRKAFGKNKKIRILPKTENDGYTGGNNYAVPFCRGRYIVVLNNDTTQKPNWLSELHAALASAPDVAMATINVVNVPNGDPARKHEVEHEFTDRDLLSISLLGYPISIGKKPIERFVEVPAVHGCSFMLDTAKVPELFDQQYFIYAEETKLSWKTRLRGHRILMATRAHVYHLHNTVRRSDPSIDARFTFLGERNKLTNWLTFYDDWTTLRLLPLFASALVMLNLKEPKKFKHRCRAYFWLLTHPRWIWKRRAEIASVRRVSDAKLLRGMSGKFADDWLVKGRFARAFLRFVNFKTRCYLRFVGIKTAP